MAAAAEGKKAAGVVAVTGASGYVASMLVKLLLERGYSVRASVRDLADPKKTEHLLALEGSKERLQLFKADLLEEGSFDALVEGCQCVFHAASPVLAASADPQAELIDPALKGTVNVLHSCLKVPTIKRVVLTSSMATVEHSERPRTPDVVVDESWFTTSEICEEKQMWYCLSKVLAEEAALRICRENNMDIVTIHPTYVIGPLVQPMMNASIEFLLKLIFGYPNTSAGFVNVKDVAMAHILACENPSANGRYCVVERVVHCSELLKIVRELYPSMKLPEKCADDKPAELLSQVSKEKIKSLGMELIPLEVSIKETFESLKEKGLLSPDVASCIN